MHKLLQLVLMLLADKGLKYMEKRIGPITGQRGTLECTEANSITKLNKNSLERKYSIIKLNNNRLDREYSIISLDNIWLDWEYSIIRLMSSR